MEIEASDIHIREDGPVYYRVRGRLEKSDGILSSKEFKAFLYKFLSEEERLQLSLSKDLNISVELGQARLRINIFKANNKDCMAIRIIEDELISLEDLSIYKDVKDILTEPNGLILITGKTGSGKSMTMNSILDYINRNYNFNILTLEDPIEYIHRPIKSLVNQREVARDVVSYEEGITSSLREDIDVLCIGELRTAKEISNCITAAETGHLVLGTIHTIGQEKTIDRMLDAFKKDEKSQVRIQLSTIIKAIFSQELIHESHRTYACFESLIINDAMRNLIRENKLHQIKNIADLGRRDRYSI